VVSSGNYTDRAGGRKEVEGQIIGRGVASMNQGEIIIYQSEDGSSAIDVHLKDETVWLTQADLAELFRVSPQNITMHLKNIYAEGELEEKPTCKEFLQIQMEGNRRVERKRKFYNLDMIISVGYRIKSAVATHFCIWATSVLKEHLVKGYTLNQRRLVENGVGELQQVLALLSNTLESNDLVRDEGMAVLDIVNRYAAT